MQHSFSKAIMACVAASLFSFFNLFLFSLMNVLAPYFLQESIVTLANLGFLSSWDLGGNVLGFIPIGLAIDTYGVRRIGLSLLALAVVATFLMGQTHSFSLLCLIRFLQGLASAASLLITMRIGASTSPHHRNITIGAMVSLALTGGMAGNAFFAGLCLRYGWSTSLKIVATIGGMIGLFLWRYLKVNSVIENNNTQLLGLNIFKQVWAKRNLLAGLHLGLFNAPVFILGSLFGNKWLMHQFNFTLMQAAYCSSVLFAGIMMGSIVWGYLADKINSIRILFSSYILLLLLSFILGFSPQLSPVEAAIVCGGMGFMCCVQNLIYPLVNDQNTITLCTTAMGMAALVSNTVGMGLQLFFSVCIHYFLIYIHSPFNVFPLVFIAGICLLHVFELVQECNCYRKM